MLPLSGAQLCFLVVWARSHLGPLWSEAFSKADMDALGDHSLAFEEIGRVTGLARELGFCTNLSAAGRDKGESQGAVFYFQPSPCL